MKKEYTSGASWNSASIAGLVMAAVTIAAELVGTLCNKVPGFGGGILNFLAWAGKIAVCALTFRALMKRFHDSYEDVDYPRLQRYGLKLALFSSLLVAAYSLVNILLIEPDSIKQALDAFREGYASMLDSNSEAVLDKMMPKMPLYVGIVTVIYCYLWGWLFSTLFAKSLAPYDPFANIEGPKENQ
ncbi:MAG: DUF4199 domain-containing protein [Bacteroidales bacterium]|nr:DUF4199 domain-containing protein [Bacteroidales bacterium]